MAEEDRRLALVVSDRPASGSRLRALLTEFEVQVVPDTDSAAILVQKQAFSMVIVDHPAKGGTIKQLMLGMRWSESPSRQAALVVLSAPETLDEAEALFDRGATRILNPFLDDRLLRDAIFEVVEHPPRFAVRAMVKLLPADAPANARRIIAQTENLSLSGMLVRNNRLLPVGGRLSFDLELPGQVTPIRGVAAVVRLIFDSDDDIIGFAARFVTLEGDGRSRLELILEEFARKRKPKPPAQSSAQ